MIQVLSRVVGAPAESIDDDSSPDSLEGWNSASHLHLILSLEEEFGISLSPEDAMEMLSVRLIEQVLQEKGIRFDEAPQQVS
jgi:acyl carrier protein